MKTLTPIYSFTFNGVTNNIYHANVDEGLPKHEHDYAHVTACHSGRLLVTKENARLEMTKDTQPVLLTENEWHELEALEDGTVFCNTLVVNG